MPKEFDPYHKWLGIHPKDQPPHDYRLLGLEPFEADPDVIDSAAERQTRHVRMYQSGEHAQQASTLLNQIATARLRLLDPRKRTEYDDALRKKLAESAPIAVKTPLAATSTSSRRNIVMLGGALAVIAIVVSVVLFRPRGERAADTIVPVITEGTPDVAKTGPENAASSTSQVAIVGQGPDVSQALNAAQQTPEGPPTSSNNKSPAKALRRPNPAAGGRRPAASTNAVQPAVASSPPGPLTGPVNLLALVDTKRDAVVGEWRKGGDELRSPETHAARLQLPFAPPAEYVLTIEAEAKVRNSLLIGLIIGASQTVVALDGYDGKLSGVHRIDGKNYNENETTRRLGCLQPGESNRIVCTVRPRSLQVACNGRTIVDWEGDAARLSNDPNFAVPNKTQLFLGSYTSYVFRRIEIAPAPPPDQSPAALPAGTLPPVDLLPHINLARDAIKGDWKFDGGVLSNQSLENSIVRLADHPGEDYIVRMTAIREAGNNALGLVLPVLDKRTAMVVNGWSGVGSGLYNLDGKDDNETYRRQAGIFRDENPHTLVCTVRGNSVSATFDGKVLFEWTGDPKRLSVALPAVPPGRELLLSAVDCRFRITELSLQRLPRSDRELAQNKLPVPDQAAIAEKTKSLREVFKADYNVKTSAGKLTLARKLAQQAEQATDDPAGQFAQWQEAIDLAATGGNLPLAFQAIAALDTRFAVDAHTLRLAALSLVAKLTAPTALRRQFMDAIRAEISDAIAHAQHARATAVAQVALEGAQKWKDADRIKRASQLLQEIDEIEAAYRSLEPVRARLLATPADPDANFQIGRFMAAFNGDWSAGLPLLTRGGDREWADVARRDLARPASADQQLELMEDWWKLSEQETGQPQQEIRLHAAQWYRAALPQLPGATGQKVEQLLANDQGIEIHRGLFRNENDLRNWVFTKPQGGRPVVRQGELLLRDNYALYGRRFEWMSTVVVRGRIVAPDLHNLRMSIGPTNLILNWEEGGNHFRGGPDHKTWKPDALTPDKLHEIRFVQEGENVVVYIDNKKCAQVRQRLSGTIVIYPSHSTIAITAVIVEGKLSADKGVNKPSHNNLF